MPQTLVQDVTFDNLTKTKTEYKQKSQLILAQANKIKSLRNNNSLKQNTLSMI